MDQSGEKQIGSEKEKRKIDFKSLAATAGLIFTLIHLIALSIRYAAGFWYLNATIISNNFFAIISVLFVSAGSWILATDTDFWNFRKRKRISFVIVVFNAVFTVLQPVYTLLRTLFIKLAFQIKVTEAMTKGMVTFLAQILLFLSFTMIIGFLIWQGKEVLFSEEAKKKIGRFKIRHYLEIHGKNNGYIAKFVKNLETGKDIIISEDTRKVHMVINGASGTGKTSSVITPQVLIDLQKKMENRTLRQSEFIKMLKCDEAVMDGKWSGEFKERYITPQRGFERKYQKIMSDYPDCGMTILAPNNSLIEDIIRLSSARGITVNVLDPAREYAEYGNVKTCGLNPFYVPLGLSEKERAIYIINAAIAFSQVLIAVNDIRDSSTDPYFVDINDSVSTNVAIAVMLGKNIEGKQADIIDIQQAIDDFTKLSTYISTIEAYLQIHIEAPEIKRSSRDVKNMADVTAFEDKIHDMEHIGMEAGKRKNDVRNNPYAATILYIKQELLGAGREKMFDQARGIRNMIDKLLFDPRIKEILSAGEEERLDFDDMLLDNQVTLVNTALEFGQATSTAFGLFFLLLQRVSVLRRPKENRSIHFLWVDEAPQYMHQVYDEMFVLYRQYNVAVALAIQSLAQTEKNQKTRYLKKVFMGAGTHVVFGRLDTDEMRIYSELAGSKEVLVSQVTRAETSMLSDRPSVTMSERTTPTVKANMEGSDMRQMDFQEIVLITVKDGRPTEGIEGKVSFVGSNAFLSAEMKRLDFSLFRPASGVEGKHERREEKPTDMASIKRVSIKSVDTLEKTMTQYFVDDEVPLDEIVKKEPGSANDHENLAKMLFMD